MKNLYIVTPPAILLSLLLMLLTACSSEGDETPAAPEVPADSIAIGMSAEGVVQSTTRAGGTEMTNALLQAKGFGVYAWYTGTADFTTPAASTYMLMRNQQIAYTTAHTPWEWHYSPAKYWPLNDEEKLTFRAYAPYQQYMPVDDGGLPVLPIHIDADDYDNDTQTDPLWGTAKDGTPYQDWTRPMTAVTPGTTLPDNTIHWHFRHGMAKIIFKAQLGQDFMLPTGGYVVVTGITLSGLYSDGALNLQNDGWLKDGKKVAETEAEYPNPKWTDQEGSLTSTVTPAATTQVKKGDLTLLTPDDGTGLLVIPIDTHANELTLTVTFDVFTADGKQQGDGTNTARVTIPGDGWLYGNTVYNFNMTLALTSKDLLLTIIVDKNWQVGAPFEQDI